MTSRDGFTIVWDWNGTLCDDRTILLDAVGQTLVNEGFEPLSQQQLIQRFARPLRTFFENACGRDLLTSEWERVQSTFAESIDREKLKSHSSKMRTTFWRRETAAPLGSSYYRWRLTTSLCTSSKNTGLPSGSTKSVAGLGPTKKNP